MLIIEDDKDLLQSMVSYLTTQRYLCETAGDYKSALAKIEDFDYDCIIVDLSLPGGDGLALLDEIKSNNKTDGVIIVSARNELDDKIKGLNSGADDYLAKPFHLSELSVRVNAIIRRKNLQGSNLTRFEEIIIDLAAKVARVNEEPLSLTAKEFDLLFFLIVNKNRVLSKNAIATHLWGDNMDYADSYDFIYTHIKNLRKKLENAGVENYLHSVYGLGYKFSLK